MQISFQDMLDQSVFHHGRLCPRQVLGVRIGMLAGTLLGIDLPQREKRLLAIVETDGCFVDGVSAATNCRVGRRTMRVKDLGKVAASFVDLSTGEAIRIAPLSTSRAAANRYAPFEPDNWHQQLLGYQIAPDEQLFSWRKIILHEPIETYISKPGMRVICRICQEEIMNEREVLVDGNFLCQTCAGDSYYSIAGQNRLSAFQQEEILIREISERSSCSILDETKLCCTG